jgi:hypothetical protein
MTFRSVRPSRRLRCSAISTFAPECLARRQIQPETSEFTLQVHIFKGPGRVFGVTTDPAGTNLPAKYAPWAAFKTIDLERGAKTPGLDVDECLQDLETHGLHVTDAHVRITEQAMR